MSKRNENIIRVPIIKSDKDICRIIFQKSDNGKYDIKLEFMGNDYKVYVHKLFERNSVEINVKNPDSTNISYHRGKNNNPVIIHLKDENAIQEKYKTLPLQRIQAPNINQKIPVPLFKIEVPDGVITKAPPYKKKSYHNTFETADNNVFEFYMTPIEYFYDTRLNESSLVYPMEVLPIEYFASNTVAIDSDKYKYWIPNGAPQLRRMLIGNLNGMCLMVNQYMNPTLNMSHINATFIENEFSTEILYNTIFRYPKHGNNNVFDGIYVGGCSLKNLEYSYINYLGYKVTDNTYVAECLKNKNYDKVAKIMLAKKASKYRTRLLKELRKHNIYN